MNLPTSQDIRKERGKADGCSYELFFVYNDIGVKVSCSKAFLHYGEERIEFKPEG